MFLWYCDFVFLCFIVSVFLASLFGRRGGGEEELFANSLFSSKGHKHCLLKMSANHIHGTTAEFFFVPFSEMDTP